MTPAPPRISVVVPSFNQAPYLRQCLDSIFAQNYPNLEVILMDGGSTDGSAAILAEYRGRFHHFQSGPDGGQVPSLNKGLFEIATGEILTWLNTDDYWAPGVLHEVAQAISPREGRWLVAGRSRWVIEPGAHQHDHPFFGSRTHRQVVQFWKHGTLPQCSVFFHRAIMQKAGPLDASEKLGFDFLFWLRLTAVPGVQVFFVDRVWSYYRLQERAKTVSAHYQSHLDLERLSRRFWPRWPHPARFAWEWDYWLSTDAYKPQEQHYIKHVQPELKKAFATRRHLKCAALLAWVLVHCPANLTRSWHRSAMHLPEFPLLALVCRRKRFRHLLARSLKQQATHLLHGVSERAFNLHPAMPGASPTRLTVDSHLFTQPRIAIKFHATVPDVRACRVELSCWLEDDRGNPTAKQAWTIHPGGHWECSPQWSGADGSRHRLVLQSQPAPGSPSNAYSSTIITDLRATVI
jgi:glycosyltransferase involved in cell wall biosynthesis